MKRGPKKYSPTRPSSGKKSKAEAIRVWDKLDTSRRGFVTVHDVLKQAKLLEAECPDFIREYESVAKDGRVTRAAFLDYCVGKAASAEERQRKVDMVQLRSMFDEVAGRADGNSSARAVPEAADFSRAGPGGQIRVADLIKHRARIQAGEFCCHNTDISFESESSAVLDRRSFRHCWKSSPKSISACLRLLAGQNWRSMLEVPVSGWNTS